MLKERRTSDFGKENEISPAYDPPAGKDPERRTETGREDELGERAGRGIWFFQADGTACAQHSVRGTATGTPPRQRYLCHRQPPGSAGKPDKDCRGFHLCGQLYFPQNHSGNRE